MENNLQIFENDNFGQLRTIDDDGKIMFFATDVATGETSWNIFLQLLKSV